MNRRHIFGAGAAVLVSSAASVRAAPDCAALPIDRAAYDRYMALFNAADPRWLEFYTADVTFSLKPMLFKGRAQIKDFYDKLHQTIGEHTRVLFFCSDQNGAAAKIEGTFRCIKDMPDPATGRLIKQGATMKMQGMVMYQIKDGKFSAIDAGPTEKIHDWQTA